MAGSQIKLPSFNYDLDNWLIHAEGYLATQSGLTDKQAFGAYIAALPTDIISVVQEVVTSPPANDKCGALKTALKDHYAKSDEEIYKEIQQISLGDGRPSALYRKMTRLNGRAKVQLPIQLLRSLHLSKMPADLQLTLDAFTADKDEGNYCTTADRMYQRRVSLQTSVNNVLTGKSDSSVTVNSVHSDSVNNSGNTSASDRGVYSDVSSLHDHCNNLSPDHSAVRSTDISEVRDNGAVRSTVNSAVRQPTTNSAGRREDNSAQHLREEIDELKHLLNQLMRKSNDTREPSLNDPVRNDDMCWYHIRFGSRALKCTGPCSWSGNSSRGGR